MGIKNLSFIRVLFNRFRRNDDGATAIEYGLLVALIAISLMVGLSQVYTSLDAMFVVMDESVAATNADADAATP